MKKLFTIAILSTMLFACKKDEKENPAPSCPVPAYSQTKYCLKNSTGFGERDTIEFNLSTVDNYFLLNTPLASMSEPCLVSIDGSGYELTIPQHVNAAGTMFIRGYGNFGDRELLLYWQTYNMDSTTIHTYYSVYSKVRI